MVIKRYPYPAWFMEMGGHTSDPDDYSSGRLDEHRAMRDLQDQVFGRICCFKPLAETILNLTIDLFSQLNPQSSSPSQVEVPLNLMITIFTELTPDQKDLK